MEFDKIRKIAAEVLNVSEADIEVNTAFAADLGADSLEIFQIICRIEDEFDIKISGEMTEQLKTVKDMVDYVRHTAV